MSGVFPVNRHVNDGAYAVARNRLNAKTIHELVVTSCHLMTVHRCDDTVAAEFLNVSHPATVDFHTVGFLQTLADGVARGTFCQSSIFHQLTLIHLIVMDRIHLKYTLSQCAGLVKNYNLSP